jgi:hypothetical protein
MHTKDLKSFAKAKPTFVASSVMSSYRLKDSEHDA